MKNSRKTGNDRSLRIKYLTNSQLQILLRYVKNSADEARLKGTTRAIVDELIIMLFVNSGLQAGELCNLRIVDLPVEHGENAIWVRDDKGKIVRTVQISSEMSEYLNKFVRMYRKAADPGKHLIINERGNPISYMSVYSKVKRIGKKAKISNLHPHMLRCTYLVRLFDNKKDLRFVQEQAGHANRKTTTLYAKMIIDREKEIETISNADYSTGKADVDSNGSQVSGKCSLNETISNRETGYIGGSSLILNCEACGKSIPEGDGTKIDSGQILCDDCLKELRSIYP